MPAPKALFDKTADFEGQPYRNITTLRESADLFDDLTDGDKEASAIAAEAEMRVKKDKIYCWTSQEKMRPFEDIIHY